MHGYCTARLHLSDAAAYRHIRAARLGRRFPLLLELVAEGKLHLTAICLLSPHLSPSNHRQLLQAAVHRSKREVELLVAERFPQPDVPSQLRKLLGPRPRPRGVAAGTTEGPAEAADLAAEVMDSPGRPGVACHGAQEPRPAEASSKETPVEAFAEGPAAAPSSANAPAAPSSTEATVANVTLRCKCHNRYDAEQHYGAAYIGQRVRQRRERSKQRRRSKALQARACILAAPTANRRTDARRFWSSPSKSGERP